MAIMLPLFSQFADGNQGGISPEGCRALPSGMRTQAVRLPALHHVFYAFIFVSCSFPSPESAVDVVGINPAALFSDRTPVGKASSYLWLRFLTCIINSTIKAIIFDMFWKPPHSSDWSHLPQIGTQTHVAGSRTQIKPTQIKPTVPGFKT